MSASNFLPGRVGYPQLPDPLYFQNKDKTIEIRLYVCQMSPDNPFGYYKLAASRTQTAIITNEFASRFFNQTEPQLNYSSFDKVFYHFKKDDKPIEIGVGSLSTLSKILDFIENQSNDQKIQLHPLSETLLIKEI